MARAVRDAGIGKRHGSTTAAQFATELKLLQLLLEQLKSAGVVKQAEGDALSDQGASVVSAQSHGGEDRKEEDHADQQMMEIKQADASARRTIQVEVRKKRVFVKPLTEATVEPEVRLRRAVIDEAELAKRDRGAAPGGVSTARQMQEAREKAERATRGSGGEGAAARRRCARARAGAAAGTSGARRGAQRDADRAAKEAVEAQQRARRAVEDEVAAIKSMMSAPKKVAKALSGGRHGANGRDTAQADHQARSQARREEGRKEAGRQGDQEAASWPPAGPRSSRRSASSRRAGIHQAGPIRAWRGPSGPSQARPRRIRRRDGADAGRADRADVRLP